MLLGNQVGALHSCKLQHTEFIFYIVALLLLLPKSNSKMEVVHIKTISILI